MTSSSPLTMLSSTLTTMSLEDKPSRCFSSLVNDIYDDDGGGDGGGDDDDDDNSGK